MINTDPTDHRLLRRITLERLLSFGPKPMLLEMQNLNILIGPNGAGKSNFIEALSLMRATPVSAASSSVDVKRVVAQGGSVKAWVWKGERDQHASIDLLLNYDERLLRHVLSFGDENNQFRLADERIGYDRSSGGTGFYYGFEQGKPVVKMGGARKRSLRPETVDRERSIIGQRRDAEQYPEIAFLAESYEQIRIYREWSFGRKIIFRQPQSADMRNDRLEEDFSNLGLIFSRLQKAPKVKAAILDGLRELYDGITDFQVHTEGGSVQMFLTEDDFSVPAIRLSDGTLRYLCLLAILCDPAPPPLICIEEPELGLHPDVLPKLADLLIEASQRTQLVVTTHSDVLVDAMTDRPEVIVVCEKHDGQTTMRRLQKKELAVWLEKYRLGQLWTDGHIGGTRW